MWQKKLETSNLFMIKMALAFWTLEVILSKAYHFFHLLRDHFALVSISKGLGLVEPLKVSNFLCRIRYMLTSPDIRGSKVVLT